MNFETFEPFSKLPFKFHICFGLFVRLAVVVCSNIHEQLSDQSVSFTDLEYISVSDAAKRIIDGRSPYRHDFYNWSPIIAYLLLPNAIWGKETGKVIYSIIDILITISIKKIIELQLKFDRNVKNPGAISEVAQRSSLLWLYNPINMGISSRGNACSVPTLFIVLSLLFIQQGFGKQWYKYILSGIFLGIATNIYLYPIFYLFPMYLSLSVFQNGVYEFLPNKRQLQFVFSCLGTVAFLFVLFYNIYGYKYLFITLIHPIVKRYYEPTFSLLFLHNYLSDFDEQFPYDYVRLFTFFCQIVLIWQICRSFAYDMKTLNFALFCQTVVLALYNIIVTTHQYVWFITLIPLVVHNLTISSSKFSYLIMLWCLAQAVWMFCLNDLEWKGKPVYIMIWWKSAFLFGTNHFTLSYFVRHFIPGHGFGKLLTRRR